MVGVTSQESDYRLCRDFLGCLLDRTLLLVLEASSLVDFVFVRSSPFCLACRHLGFSIVLAMEAQTAIWVVDAPLLLFGLIAGDDLFGR